MIIEVSITNQIFEEALNRNLQYQKRFGNIGTHRLNKDRQRMTGYLAESCIRSIFPSLQYSKDDTVDFLYSNITLDSKAQGCNSKPLKHFTATLYEEQKHRPVDYYIFSRIKNDFSVGWICGVISKERFFDNAKLAIAGTRTNNFVYDQSRYEIQYDMLTDINNFIEEISNEKI